MEQLGEENRIPFYTRIFYELDEGTCMGIENWLRKNGGPEFENWRTGFTGLYYYTMGYEQSDVGVIGNLYVEIYDSHTAFQFEIFKVGGMARDRTQSGYDPYNDIFNPVEEDFIID